MTQTPDVPVSVPFNTFGLHPDILKSIEKTGYTQATPIQTAAIPIVLNGQDVMGAAQTGTGKTAAFTLPLLHRIMPYASFSMSPAKHPVRALILAPTRELAVQVADNVKKYAEFTPLKVVVVYGGVDIHSQKEQLLQGCEVLIATPGRLLDHIEQKNVRLNQVQLLVLDEADRMLDMGFLPDLERIMREVPEQKQSLLFSATFSPEIRRLATAFLKNPVPIEVASPNATSDNVSQIAYQVDADEKTAATIQLAEQRADQSMFIFTNTKINASRLARSLQQFGLKAESIHGDKSQAERSKVLEEFKNDTVKILVATDVAARGLDVAGVHCVINYDLPYNAEDYVHRIGRTGRAGSSGAAIALVSDKEARLLQDIEKLIKTKLPLQPLEIKRERYSNDAQRQRQRYAQRSRVDDVFFQPYVPSRPASSVQQNNTPTSSGLATSSRSVGGSHHKKKVALLLGGNG